LGFRGGIEKERRERMRRMDKIRVRRVWVSQDKGYKNNEAR